MSKIILSLDGGGIRGAATTQFLSHVEKELQDSYGKSLRDCVDFYAGTSTGAIIALALATTQLTVSEINELYNVTNARKIFADNKGWFELDGINSPKYEAKGKSELLKKNMGPAKIGDVASDKHVLAVTYSIETRRPEVIKSTEPTHLKLLSCDVADASSAAPTYFPTKELRLGGAVDEAWLVDGGVTANNPTMCAVAEARKIWAATTPMEQLRVLSIGTGYRTRKINGPESRKWGALGWVTKGSILDLLSDERVVAYQAQTIINPGNYIRVNSEMKRQPGLDSAPDDAMDDISNSNIKKLKAMGDFWYNRYGESVIKFLLGDYNGPSLDRIDPRTGLPIEK
ncbi:patatin-like phospholipase family protein [Halioxenophilus sp. WMMB6]|uniref:patatin-like phospholipase family protein n=1 Tax=Halioxenophilus sp. WMMB6 TaxID=3073815 RepID=UPI00295EC29F|nr:patatin-like phospholipase family protein [Halioxenophilus sp. WMMB6]